MGASQWPLENAVRVTEDAFIIGAKHFPLDAVMAVKLSRRVPKQYIRRVLALSVLFIGYNALMWAVLLSIASRVFDLGFFTLPDVVILPLMLAGIVLVFSFVFSVLALMRAPVGLSYVIQVQTKSASHDVFISSDKQSLQQLAHTMREALEKYHSLSSNC